MLPVKITPLDAGDPDQMAAWHATYHAANVFGRAVSAPWRLEEMRAELLAEGRSERKLAWSGYVDGLLVTTGLISLPLQDNLHAASLDVHTNPEHRNQAFGSTMLDHLTSIARAHDRRTLTAEAASPYHGPADGHGHPNADFLLHRGFECALGDVMRVLDLPADEQRLRRLVEDAAPHHRDYTIRQFTGPVPADILDSFGVLIGSLMTEAPMGELEMENEVFDEERIREDESVFEASGRTKYTTIAVAHDGEVAAYSELVVPKHDPGRVYQWGTLARREHRGHRLGQATKARNLLWLQREHRDGGLLVTYNAEVNSDMIAVNEAMGFRPVERLGEYQKKLG